MKSTSSSGMVVSLSRVGSPLVPSLSRRQWLDGRRVENSSLATTAPVRWAVVSHRPRPAPSPPTRRARIQLGAEVLNRPSGRAGSRKREPPRPDGDGRPRPGSQAGRRRALVDTAGVGWRTEGPAQRVLRRRRGFMDVRGIVPSVVSPGAARQADPRPGRRPQLRRRRSTAPPRRIGLGERVGRSTVQLCDGGQHPEAGGRCAPLRRGSTLRRARAFSRAPHRQRFQRAMR